MKPCKKCQKNKWQYLKLDNDPHIYCTCKKCGYKFSFLVPKKKCIFCRESTDFENLDIDDDHRGKKCLKCGRVKIIETAKAIYENGKLLCEDGEFHEVDLVDVGKGALQILPID